MYRRRKSRWEFSVLKPFLPAVALWLAASAVISSVRAQGNANIVYSHNDDANALVAQGKVLLAHSDPRVGGSFANAREAIKLFEQAVSKDPTLAIAYVDMARAWLRLGYSNPGGAPNSEILPPTKAALAKAVALDPNLPDGHLMLAAVAYNIDYE